MRKIQIIVFILSSVSGIADLNASYQLVYQNLTPISISQPLCLTSWLKLKPLVDTIPYLKSSAPPFELILFDADETLFHYDAFKGLKIMFSRFGEEFNEHDFDRFMKINKSLWMEYQNGNITADELQKRRFESWAEKISVPAQILNKEYINTMIEISTPIEGALNLLKALKGKTKLGIITNGFTQLQQRRLEKTGFKDFFDLLVVAEETGFAKPSRAIFDYALSRMGNPIREKVLMVGDSLEFDIQGGINAEIKTCWFNVNNKSSNGIVPNYRVSSFKELEILLSKTIHKIAANW